MHAAHMSHIVANICRLRLRPAPANLKGSCQMIARACFTAKPGPNLFHPLHLMFLSWLFLFSHGDGQNWILMPKGGGSASCFIQGLRVNAFKQWFDAMRQFRTLIFMGQFQHMHNVKYWRSPTSCRCCWVTAICKQRLHTGKSTLHIRKTFQTSQPLSCGLWRFVLKMNLAKEFLAALAKCWKKLKKNCRCKK